MLKHLKLLKIFKDVSGCLKAVETFKGFVRSMESSMESPGHIGCIG